MCALVVGVCELPPHAARARAATAARRIPLKPAMVLTGNAEWSAGIRARCHEKLRRRDQSSGIDAVSGQRVTGAPCSRPFTPYGTVRCAIKVGELHIQATSDGS